MPCPEGEVSGNMEVWTQDQDCDCRRESGDRLSGRSDGRHGKVLLEVRSGQAGDTHLQRVAESTDAVFSFSLYCSHKGVLCDITS